MSRGAPPSDRVGAWSVPVKPWIADVGRRALEHGVYVYGSDGFFEVELGISRGSLDGVPFRPYTLVIYREALDDVAIDLVEYACGELRAQFAWTPPRSLA